jgi:hypothetical protein
VKYLGVGRDHKEQVFIAKFVRDPGINEWHGYPVNPRRGGDKPPTTILNRWLSDKLLSPQKIRKIKGNQPCKL